MDKKVQVALLGVGCMGEAMVRGLLQHKDELVITGIVRREDSAAFLRQKYEGANFALNADGVIESSDVLVLCMKPQQFNDLSGIIKGRLSDHCLVVSILAGVNILKLQQNLGHDSVVRAMPNTPAQIGRGYTGWCPAKSLTPEQLERAQMVLGSMGSACQYLDEQMLDTVTAISGSGPGTLAYLIQAYIEAAVKNGMTRGNAREAVLRTVQGTAEYLLDSNEHPSLLQDRVTSPGGTTAAIVYELDRAGVRAAVTTSIDAGIARCRELNKS
jgi:pyrroline-5-carboxylate reductase